MWLLRPLAARLSIKLHAPGGLYRRLISLMSKVGLVTIPVPLAGRESGGGTGFSL